MRWTKGRTLFFGNKSVNFNAKNWKKIHEILEYNFIMFFFEEKIVLQKKFLLPGIAHCALHQLVALELMTKCYSTLLVCLFIAVYIEVCA